MSKKRILHLITGLDVGGTEMMLLKILPKMQDRFDNRVCCIMGHGEIGKKLEGAGVPVFYLDLKNILDISAVLRFKKILEKFKPEVLSTYLIHADLFGRIFGRIFGIKKIVCSQRGSLLQWGWLRFFDRATKFLVTKYIVQTETAKKELMKKLHVPENKFEVIPNSIDLKEYDFEINKEKKKQKLEINTDNLNIVCVSNLRRGKGHEYLLQAFEKIFENDKNLNLLIVGDGEKMAELKRQAENYHSKNNIHFLGKRNDVKEILKISDIFVLPTLGEGMSNAILEALASSLPVITTDIPVNKEIITDNVTGFLVKPRQSRELSEKIQFLIVNPEIRKELGLNGKKLIENRFAISKISSMWADILRNL